MSADPSCQGTGHCAGCRGTGFMGSMKIEHGLCEGTGTCQACNGTGRVRGYPNQGIKWRRSLWSILMRHVRNRRRARSGDPLRTAEDQAPPD
jgi:hypothetical protein